jgi:TonB-dependent SusC/RagA subfamily outer membrane receptor
MQKYFLHINEPCSKDWDKMTPEIQGRFCTSCNKTVLDFTTATDTEIIKHIEKIKGEEFCGKFEEYQLGKWIETMNLKSSNSKLYELLLSFFLLTAVQNLSAQSVNKKEKIELKQRADSILSGLTVKSEKPDIVCDTSKGVINNTRIRMGGVRTLTGNNKTLIIWDGIPMKMGTLNKFNPNEIKSIDILKSKEATLIYGPDGVNGVILITTKSPKKGKIDLKTSLNPNS